MDPVSAVANAIGGIFQTLPSLGLGAKSRKSEIQNQALAQTSLIKTQAEIDEEKSKNTTKIIIISGILLLVIVVIFLTLRKK